MFLSDSPHDKYWTSLHQLHMWSAHTSVQNYIQSSEMDKDGTWGSKVEIFTLAHMLPTNITLVMLDMPVGIFSARPMSTEVRQLTSSKVVCHGLGNLISCLHDIIVMLQCDWPTLERALSQTSWPVYEVRYKGVGIH